MADPFYTPTSNCWGFQSLQPLPKPVIFGLFDDGQPRGCEVVSHGDSDLCQPPSLAVQACLSCRRVRFAQGSDGAYLTIFCFYKQCWSEHLSHTLSTQIHYYVLNIYPSKWIRWSKTRAKGLDVYWQIAFKKFWLKFTLPVISDLFFSKSLIPAKICNRL